MRKVMFAVAAVMALCVAGTFAFAGNVHRDGAGIALPDVFTPGKTTSTTHTKADVRYTPSSGTKVVRVNSDAAVFFKLSSAQNKKDTVGFPVAANTPITFGIGTRSGTGVDVKKLVFSGASSATKTIYIQEQ